MPCRLLSEQSSQSPWLLLLNARSLGERGRLREPAVQNQPAPPRVPLPLDPRHAYLSAQLGSARPIWGLALSPLGPFHTVRQPRVEDGQPVEQRLNLCIHPRARARRCEETPSTPPNGWLNQRLRLRHEVTSLILGNLG